jgi:integrase
MGALADHLNTIPEISTRRNYQASLFDYCDILFGRQRAATKTTQEERVKYHSLVDSLIDDYTTKKRDYFRDMQKYLASLNGRMTPMSGRNYINCIRTFFLFQRIELSNTDWRLLKPRIPKGGAQTIESEINHEVIRSVISHGDSRIRALVLVMASSGIRLNEALALQLEDINLKADPVELSIRGIGTKTGSSRLVFISSEAKQAILEWLKMRDAYKELAWKRTSGFAKKRIISKNQEGDNRLFPFADQTAFLAWDNAVKKAGYLEYDPVTKRSKLHLHMLRKFFRSNLGLNAPEIVVETLMGHEGYLGGAYRRLTREQLRNAYMKAHHALVIQGDKASIDKIVEIGKENELLKVKIKEIEQRQAEQQAIIGIMNQVLSSLSPEKLAEVQNELLILANRR